MKSLPALILLFSFTWTQFYNSAVIGVYELNTSEYIAEFCENQDKPELECNGKCHLSKQLVDVQKEPQSNEPPTLIPEQELFTYQFNFDSKVFSTKKEDIPFCFPCYSSIDLSGLDHPPRA